jgi:ABC-type amino acid transport substrate-binding protein
LNLDDDDLLEMVNAGRIPAAIIDDYFAYKLVVEERERKAAAKGAVTTRVRP